MGITTLPQDPKLLEQRLKASENGFKTGLFLFTLEVDGKPIGCSGITAKRGKLFPMHTYQIREASFKSKELKIEREMEFLHFHTVTTYPTELGSLFLEPDYRAHGYGSLLSYARFLFIAAFCSHFAPLVVAELRGVSSDDGRCPFWECVGAHFFQMDFDKADYLRIAFPKCVEEIFPKIPLCIKLLTLEAQKVIGVPHPKTVPAMELLKKQGFIQSNIVDLFDAGPHFYAATHKIAAIRESQKGKIHEIVDKLDHEELHLITNTSKDFRATRDALLAHGKKITLAKDVAELLQLKKGDEIRFL